MEIKIKGITAKARSALVQIKTFFLFQLSTYAPAKIPKRMEGRVNESTTPATAKLDLDKLNTTINFESLPNAIYFVKVISNSKNKVISVIKK